MLKGEYSHNIDAKGRLIIPAKFRDDLGEHFVITKGMENCLYVYPEAEWNTFEEKLNALPTTTDKKARAFASECRSSGGARQNSNPFCTAYICTSG